TKNIMGVKNKTQVTVFELSGLTDNKFVALFLFVLFLMVYIVAVLGNIGMMAMVYISPSLHTPMYYLLRYLSLVDLFYSSVLHRPAVYSVLNSVTLTL
ncbi:hypothetical protein AB205_0076700, partial [Aquarana catesbeiana]